MASQAPKVRIRKERDASVQQGPVRRLHDAQVHIHRLEALFGTLARLEVPAEELRAVIRRLCGAAQIGNWAFVHRMAGRYSDFRIVGVCKRCGINLYGHGEPDVMPCNVPGCPYENLKDQAPLKWEDLKRMDPA